MCSFSAVLFRSRIGSVVAFNGSFPGFGGVSVLEAAASELARSQFDALCDSAVSCLAGGRLITLLQREDMGN